MQTQVGGMWKDENSGKGKKAQVKLFRLDRHLSDTVLESYRLDWHGSTHPIQPQKMGRILWHKSTSQWCNVRPPDKASTWHHYVSGLLTQASVTVLLCQTLWYGFNAVTASVCVRHPGTSQRTISNYKRCVRLPDISSDACLLSNAVSKTYLLVQYSIKVVSIWPTRVNIRQMNFNKVAAIFHVLHLPWTFMLER